MIDEITQQEIIDYLDSKLSDVDRKKVENLLASNNDARTFYEQLK